MKKNQKGKRKLEKEEEGKNMIVLILSLPGRRRTDKETIKKRWIVIVSSTCRLLDNRESKKKRRKKNTFPLLIFRPWSKEKVDPAAAPSTFSSDSL